MTAWRQNVTFQRYQLKNALHNGCNAESFSHCVPFSEYEQEMGKREKSPTKRRHSRPPHGARHLRSRAAAASSAARPQRRVLSGASSAARPQRRLSLSLEPEAAEHDRVRGRQAEGKDEQRPFVRSNTTALHTMPFRNVVRFLNPGVLAVMWWA